VSRACLVIALLAWVLAGCRSPTEIVLEVQTDALPCPAQRDSTLFVVGKLDQLAGRAPSSSAALCATSEPSTLVVTPSGSKSAEVAVEVILGVERDAEQCAANQYVGCIVARRALHFVPHESVRVPIAMRRSCISRDGDSKVCAWNETCVRGACKPAECASGADCAQVDSDPIDTTITDAGADTSIPDARGDTGGPDAGPADTGPADTGPADTGTSDTGPLDAWFPPLGGAIAAGPSFSCAASGDGGLACWGQNQYGELGNDVDFGSESARHDVPAIVSGLPPIVAVSGGGKHTCALDRAGTVWCWGNNDQGQLGVTHDAASYAPAPVPGLDTDVVEIAAGGYHTCSRHKDGSVRWWGTTDGWAPTTMIAGRAAQVVAGSQHACARLEDGKVRCWGANYAGQVGQDPALTSGNPVRTPIEVPLPGAAAWIAAGLSHTCASLVGSGTVVCWGANDYGQLGRAIDGGNDYRPAALTAIDAGLGYIAAGKGYNCGLRRDGSLACWGGKDDFQARTPELAGPHVTQIAIGHEHACVRRADESAWCWGRNGKGQLGAAGGDNFDVAVRARVP
jgi:hypothetical protein